MKKKMSKFFNVKNNNKTLINSILIVFITFSVVVLCLMNILQIVGSVSFKSNDMQNIFFAGIMYLYLIVIYEYRHISNNVKFILMGILSGNILFVCEEMCSLLLVFFVNVLWSKIIEAESYRSALGDIVKVFFCGMAMLEIYSVFTLANQHLYEMNIQNSMLFNFVDVLFVISAILYFCFEKEKTGEFVLGNELVLKKKKGHLRIVRLFIWCFFVLVIVAIVIGTLYMNRENPIEVFQFYFGKTIDGGYLLIEEVETSLIFYAKRREPAVGGIFENMLSFDLINLEDYFSYQIALMYVLKFIYYVLYSVYGICIMSMAVIIMLGYKISKYIKKFKRNIELRG